MLKAQNGLGYKKHGFGLKGDNLNIFKCKSCGGETEKKGNVYICVYCQSRWEQDPENDINAVDRAGAWKSLREGDFEKAQTEFENIIGKEKTNYEAWWGKALADNHITYVNDLNENKKVPTCNNITNDVFAESTAVKKAIENAPADIAEGYKKMAEQIDRIRVEWLDLASKEPPYDVFLSYKDSDKERGLARTQDSIDAQDLYNALVAEGYKVFFSRISLRDKISEQYEPYIYNAIRTAKVMIVFGERPEYFSSTWIKNEWSRFRTRIEKKEKHKNSLVVVYKDMDPNELPASLRSRQCMNMSDMTFLSDLNRHIARIIESEKAKAGLERITIESGVIGKKATRLDINEIKTKELNTGKTETDITALETLKLVDSYLATKSWDSASRLIDQVLFDEPGSLEATWRLLLLEMKAEDDIELIKKINYFKVGQYERLIKILDNAPAAFASKKLKLMFKSLEYACDKMGEYLLDRIMVYNFTGRNQCIKSAFSLAIKSRMYKTFCKLLLLLDSSKVDLYIDYNMRYAEKWGSEECMDRVLAVDEGNSEALWLKLYAQNTKDGKIKSFENVLRFSLEPDKEVVRYLNEVSEIDMGVEWCVTAATEQDMDKGNTKKTLDEIIRVKLAVITQVIKYYKGNIKDIINQIEQCADILLENEMFDDAEECYRLALNTDSGYIRGYFGICLSNLYVTCETDIVFGKKLIGDIPEYSKYLSMVSEERRRECIALEEKQKVFFVIMKEASDVIRMVDSSYISTLEAQKTRLETSIKDCKKEITQYDVLLGKLTASVVDDYNRMKIDLSKKRGEFQKLKAEYDALGLFSGKRKKEIKTESCRLDVCIDEIEKKIRAYENEFQVLDRSELAIRKERAIKLLEKDKQDIRALEKQMIDFDWNNKGIYSIKIIRERYKNPVYSIYLDKVNDIGELGIMKVGAKVNFGTSRYIILEIKDGKALLLSDSCIEKKEWIEKEKVANFDMSWEHSSARSYLNSTYYNNTFTRAQRAQICFSIIHNSGGVYSKKIDGEIKKIRINSDDTLDNIFLLSKNEVEKYFPSAEKRIGELEKEKVAWWLRSNDPNCGRIQIVVENGHIGNANPINSSIALRPALWVDISIL